MRKELKRLNPTFRAYANSLVVNRGWTPTMATETARMRQSAASRVATEERQLRRDEELVRGVERTRRRIEMEALENARVLTRARWREMEVEARARELARNQSRRDGEAAAAVIAAQTTANLANMENQDDNTELRLDEEDLAGLYYSDDEEVNVHDENEDGGVDNNNGNGTNDHLEMDYAGETNAGVMVGGEFIPARYDLGAVPPVETQNEGVDMSGAPPSGGATDS
jgi:hypothetical protein